MSRAPAHRSRSAHTRATARTQHSITACAHHLCATRHAPSRSPSAIHCAFGQLYVNDCDISDIGAAYLAEGLRANRSLARLGVAGNHITDRGAQALAGALTANKMLSTVWSPLSPQGF